MGPRKTDHPYRKDRILGIVVEQYIRTVTPVSSGFIAEKFFPELSSATIRNILADLEREGLLTHPHTSAGRVPTEEGYRYYVDNLMREIRLLDAEQRQIREEYERGVRDLEEILERTSETISGLTHCVSIVSVDGWQGRLFFRGTQFVVGGPDFSDWKRVRDILRILETKERLLQLLNRDLEQKIAFYIGHELALAEMEGCSLVVSRYQIRRKCSGRLAVLGPTRMDYARVGSALDYCSRVLQEMAP